MPVPHQTSFTHRPARLKSHTDCLLRTRPNHPQNRRTGGIKSLERLSGWQVDVWRKAERCHLQFSSSVSLSLPKTTKSSSRDSPRYISTDYPSSM